tara:strand:+ start:1676 stop:1972 length:297 start_codon:yes stop_codon:yes gene_type:complete
MNYKPLPDTLTIKKSTIQGLGLFATTDIPQSILGIGWVKQDIWPDGFVRTPMGGFINHSETPNCEKVMHEEVGVMWLKTTRDIKAGEELTIKYTMYQL